MNGSDRNDSVWEGDTPEVSPWQSVMGTLQTGGSPRDGIQSLSSLLLTPWGGGQLGTTQNVFRCFRGHSRPLLCSN